jgi:hypothetical protein
MQGLVSGVERDQLLNWSPPAPGTYYEAPGRFTWGHADDRDPTQDFAAWGDVRIDSLHVAAIPEPEIYAMMMVGLGMLGWLGRRKKLKERAAA